MKRLITRTIAPLLLLTTALGLDGCLLKQDRTTTVYGTVVDQDRQPVKDVLIIVSGHLGFSRAEKFHHLKTNETGEYSVTFDVPKGIRRLDVSIASMGIDPLFSTKYKDYLVFKDNNQTQECCAANIGEKTKYVFILLFN